MQTVVLAADQEPSGQHTPAPRLLLVFTGHGWQVATEVAPVEEEKEFAAHAWQVPLEKAPVAEE